jgi:hypothetical protein
MAAAGLHLKQVSLPGIYHFRRGDPANIIYRLDYQTLKKKDRRSYLQLFHDAGWEHVGNMSGWEYFRKKVHSGEHPEIYSDVDSKIKKYHRIMTYLVIFLPILIVLVSDLSARYGPWFFILEGFFAALILIYAFAIFKLFRRINQLKNQ